MSTSSLTGPYVSTGNLRTDVIQDPDCGPDLSFQASGIVDPRYISTDVGTALNRKLRSLFSCPIIPLIDAVPQAGVANNLFAAATVAVTTAATAAQTAGLGVGFLSANMAFAAGSTPGAGNVAANIPILPFGAAPISSNLVTVPAALEFGYALGGNVVTTTAGSASITLVNAANNKFFSPGQYVLVARAGNAGGTLPLSAQVTSVSGATLVLNTPCLSTNASGTQIGTAWPTQDNASLYAYPYEVAGIDALADPAQSLSRVLRVVSNNVADTGYSLIVRGYDIANTPMTEVIAVTANGTAYGKKAWKYVIQMNLFRSSSTTTTGTITVGTGDTFGAYVKSDFWEYADVYWNATQQTSQSGSATNGWLAADATSPATATTGDVRGTVQCGANGAGTNVFTTSPNGTIRLTMFLYLSTYNATNATNLNYTSLFGVPQYAG